MVQLPSSVNYLGYDLFYNNSVMTYVLYAGENVPTIGSGTFSSGASSKICSTATYRGMNALKADSKWNAAFSTIARHRGFMASDFQVYNSTNGCWQYYVIKNGIPYNGNSSNPSVRSMCMLVGATFTDGSNYTISLPQSVGNSSNNSPGSYRFYGVADSAFMNNTAITQVTNNNTMAYKIGVRSFYGCTNLTSAEVAVDTIYEYAFYNCPKLTTVELEREGLQGVERIGSYAFGKCGFNDNVTIPVTTKSIGYAPFYDNPFYKILVDANNPYYSSFNNALYNKQRTVLYQVPGKWIHTSAAIQFPETLQRILQYAAAGCWETSLELPFNLTTIDQYAFQNCKSLEKVHFPSSVTTVNVNAFAGCDAINCVELNMVTPPTIDYFPSVTDKSSVELYTPREGYEAYDASSIWSQYNRKTGVYDHQNCWDIRSGDFRYTVTSTSPYSYNGFSGDGTVKVVTIPFSGSFSIPTSITYASKKYVPNEIGYRVGQLEDDIIITKDPSITTIGDNAFEYTYLNKIPFTNVEIIGKRAFLNCYKLSVDLGTGSTPMPHLKKIMEEAFLSSGVISFTAPTCLEYIGYGAFMHCSDLHEIFLPHIDGKHPITCGDNFFYSNADDFKCWVDYRRLNDFTNSLINLDKSKVFPHAKLDSEWQTFACVKPIDFEGSGLTAYTVTDYNQSEKKAILSPINTLKEHHGAVVHGEADGTYYRLKYSSLLNNPTSEFLQGVTYDQTVHSDN
ncbi:MAG: leucine-rich repeat protein, partial [Muribaculaceae bacterium]|nr:leucine-rich repeat protein [Muribaculaceae bacterium]